jgi:DNA-binding NtrC family response regulator
MQDSPKTILVVDDEDSIRNLASLVLESDGYQVLKARHSDEALLLMDSHRDTISLLLTDVRMDPYMNGCELAKCMRLMRPDILVLYISGYTHNAMVQQEVEDQRASFLPKPFSPKDLLEKVRGVLTSTTPTA